MAMMAMDRTRRVALYSRVSSEDQRDRQTIRTQTDELARALAADPTATLVEQYADDGVSGTIPLAERPAGGQLMRAAVAGRFDELWTSKFDRLGRDAVDLLVVRRRFLDLGIRVRSVVEGEPDLLGYDVQAVVADHGRRDFLRRSADGMNRCAREGRYVGGVVPYGYRVVGTRPKGRLEPDMAPVWADLSAAEVIQRMYGWLAREGWSCRRIAAELNSLGIPTHYARDERGVRGQRTQGLWRAGRVRNMLVNPVYRGELRYGVRTRKREREQITAAVEPVVSVELWQAAQDALKQNRIMATSSKHSYLLKSVMRCGLDGLTYCGSQSGGAAWYRCGGQLVERGSHAGRCPGQSIKGDAIEPAVWADIERFLRDPGEILAELDVDAEREGAGATREADTRSLTAALADLEVQRQRAVGLAVRGAISDTDLDAEPAAPVLTADLLAELRAALDGA